MQKQNIFSNIPSDLSKELFEDILKTDCFKMERIISNEHSSPEGFWYDQDQDEWVIVLKGSAAVLPFTAESVPSGDTKKALSTSSNASHFGIESVPTLSTLPDDPIANLVDSAS